MTVEEELPDEGTYTLVVEVHEATTVSVGALGDLDFDATAYTYTGSAFGTGGMKRVERHKRTANGENSARHWHIDYLLGAPESELVAVYATPKDAECEVVELIDGTKVDRFGASDCDCESHLKIASEEAVAQAYEQRSIPFRRLEL